MTTGWISLDPNDLDHTATTYEFEARALSAALRPIDDACCCTMPAPLAAAAEEVRALSARAVSSIIRDLMAEAADLRTRAAVPQTSTLTTASSAIWGNAIAAPVPAVSVSALPPVATAAVITDAPGSTVAIGVIGGAPPLLMSIGAGPAPVAGSTMPAGSASIGGSWSSTATDSVGAIFTPGPSAPSTGFRQDPLLVTAFVVPGLVRDLSDAQDRANRSLHSLLANAPYWPTTRDGGAP